MSDLTVVQTDTAPSVYGTLAVSGVPVNLADCAVRFQMRSAIDNRLCVDGEAAIVSEPDGTVRYDWAPGDLSELGDFLSRWQITYSDLSVQHTTPENTITVGSV
jgi:hypothetical protein